MSAFSKIGLGQNLRYVYKPRLPFRVAPGRYIKDADDIVVAQVPSHAQVAGGIPSPAEADGFAHVVAKALNTYSGRRSKR